MIKLSLINLSFEDGIILGKEADKGFGFIIEGHACSGIKGEDLVCAAISAISETILFSMIRIASGHINSEVKTGYIKAIVEKKSIDYRAIHDMLLLINTLLIGFAETARQYPDKIEIKIKPEGE